MTVQAVQQGTVDLDLCWSCRALWFEPFENVKLTKEATLGLFRRIGERPAAAALPPFPAASTCPRCGKRLRLTHDMQRNTRFQYFRCGAGHGRFTRFVDFLKEKDFVRPPSAELLRELKRNLRSVRCSSCGAPVDLVKASECAHCGSPLSVLDVKKLSQLAAAPRSGPDEDASRRSQAVKQAEVMAAMLAAHRRRSEFDPVEWGLEWLGKWLRRRLG